MSRFNKLKRDKKRRTEDNSILIVCGGKTETIYFKQFNSDIGEIKVKAILKPQSPLKIVEYTIKESRKKPYRQIWCVFDKDEFKDFDSAITKASENGIKVAYSNQAFELWFILHYKNQNAPLDRTKYCGILSKYMNKKYDKTDESHYVTLEGKINEAIENAKYGHQVNKSLGPTKPSERESITTVYKLVEELQRWK